MPFTDNKTFKKNPRLITDAKGVYLTNHQGKKMIDASSGLFCNPLGHGRKEITEAVSKQLDKLDYCQPFNQGFGGSFELATRIAKKTNLDLAKAYKGIAVSSGNSFVHETESQVILNGSYNINFTMDLVLKDTGLFDDLAKKLNAPLEISPKVVEIFKDGQKKYGSRAWSSMIVKRMEDANNIDFRATGFPSELIDNEPEEKGYEI